MEILPPFPKITSLADVRAETGISFPMPPEFAGRRVVEFGKAVGLNALASKAIKLYLPQGNAQNPESYYPQTKGYLGNAVLSNLSIRGENYVKSNGQRVAFPDLVFDAVLFQVNQPKNIVWTNVQGKDGAVAEYIGNGNFEISIKGVIAGLNGQYPDRNNGAQSGKPGDTVNVVEGLLAALNCPQELTVDSWYLTQIFEIYQIVVTGYELWQGEGEFSMQRFSITAKSDMPFVVRLNA